MNSRPSTERNTIRVIDDDPAVLGSLRFSLEIEGYHVDAFGSAEEFLTAPPSDHACLLVDQNLKSTTGLDLIEEIRRRGGTQPIVLITSHASPAVRRRAEAAGVPIVEKPFLGNALIDTIRSITAR